MQQDPQFDIMTKTPIPRLILKLALPSIVSMLVTAVYNAGDTFFVSKLGTSASGAVGIAFSLMAIIQALGFTIGMGSGSIVSRALGQQDHDRANRIACSALYAAAVMGLAITIVGNCFLGGLCVALGATDTILPYAQSYASYILYAAPFMCTTFALNSLLRAEGKSRFAMVGVGIGGVLNLVLDPLFIFGFNMGIAGAAIATGLCQCISFVILLSMFLRKKATLRLSFRGVSRTPADYLLIFYTGMSSLVRQGLASIATILLNTNARVYGDSAVAAMSIVTKLFMLMFSLVIGFGQGYQPVIGYNYGAMRFDRVQQAFYFTLKACTGTMLTLAIGGFIAAPALLRAFIPDDPAVLETGTLALRAQCVALPLLPLSTLCNMSYQSLGRAVRSTLLASLRQGFFFLPLITTLPRLVGLRGVQLAQAGSDVLTFLVCVPIIAKLMREMKRKEQAQLQGE